MCYTCFDLSCSWLEYKMWPKSARIPGQPLISLVRLHLSFDFGCIPGMDFSDQDVITIHKRKTGPTAPQTFHPSKGGSNGSSPKSAIFWSAMTCFFFTFKSEKARHLKITIKNSMSCLKTCFPSICWSCWLVHRWGKRTPFSIRLATDDLVVQSCGEPEVAPRSGARSLRYAAHVVDPAVQTTLDMTPSCKTKQTWSLSKIWLYDCISDYLKYSYVFMTMYESISLVQNYSNIASHLLCVHCVFRGLPWIQCFFWFL